jgi:hypothetical protein
LETGETSALKACEEIVASGPQRGAAGAQEPECTRKYMGARLEKQDVPAHILPNAAGFACRRIPESTAQATIRHAQQIYSQALRR